MTINNLEIMRAITKGNTFEITGRFKKQTDTRYIDPKTGKVQDFVLTDCGVERII